MSASFEAEGHTVARCNERISCPQGLKPGFTLGFTGTTKVVPFRPFSRPGLISAPQSAALIEFSFDFPAVEIAWIFCEVLALTGFCAQRMFIRFRGQSDSH